MTRLSQVIAAEGGHKSRALTAVTAAHHAVQRTQQISGLHRTYRPKAEEGEQLPSESQIVQVRATDAIDQVKGALTKLFDVTFTKDLGNQTAQASVVVDDYVVVANAPVSFLLFLEKQLNDIATFVRKLPVLDPAEQWHLDESDGLHKTAPVETHRTKKVMRNHVKAEATDRHPAQVEVYTEDVTVGYWKLIKTSGALPQSRVSELADRVHRLQEAVKHAREEANSIEVQNKDVGERVLNWLFA